MIVVGTHSEINYIISQCTKRNACEGCVLEKTCTKTSKSFLRLNPSKLKALETGEYGPILIMKEGVYGNELPEES